MDDAQRQALLEGPALGPPDGVFPNYADPPNNTTLAICITIVCLLLTSLAILSRTHSWRYIFELWTGRVEACECCHL
jgi:hypothetical protein